MNPILDELHAIREHLLLESGGSLDALVDRLQEEEQQSDRSRFLSHQAANVLPPASNTQHGQGCGGKR